MNAKFKSDNYAYNKHLKGQNTERPFNSSNDSVPKSKFKEVADKLIKKRLKNEKLREEMKTTSKKNTYLYESNIFFQIDSVLQLAIIDEKRV